MEKLDRYQQYINDLTEEDRKALGLLSNLFDEEGKWPSERAFRQKLKGVIGKDKCDHVLAKLSPHFLVCANSGSHDANFELRLGGMCALDGEEKTVSTLICKYFDYIKEEYRADPDVSKFTSDELQMALKLTDYELQYLHICIEVGHLWGRSASGLSKNKNEQNKKWEVGLISEIEKLDDAESSGAYLNEILVRDFERQFNQSPNDQKAKFTFPLIYSKHDMFEELLHSKVSEASIGLLKNRHFADASFRAVLALEKEVQRLSSSSYAGVELMNKAFSPKNPLIKLNENKTDSDMNEQEGLMFMFRGAVQAIRNLHAHDNLEIDELEAKRVMVLASFLFQKLDNSVPVHSA